MKHQLVSSQPAVAHGTTRILQATIFQLIDVLGFLKASPANIPKGDM